MTFPRRPLIIGLGSPHGDDRAGWAVVERLRSRGGASARSARDGSDVLMALEGEDDVVLVDASAPSGCPGRLRAYTWPSPALGQARLLGTHALGLVEALRLAESLGSLPRRVRVLAIEAESSEIGASLGPSVARAVDRLVEQLLADEEPQGPDSGRYSGGASSSHAAAIGPIIDRAVDDPTLPTDREP